MTVFSKKGHPPGWEVEQERNEFEAFERAFAAELDEEARDRMAQEWGRAQAARDGTTYDPERYQWTRTPPTVPTCPLCSEWRRYPAFQRQFGWAWWGICDLRTCDHAHHKNEVWLASGDYDRQRR